MAEICLNCAARVDGSPAGVQKKKWAAFFLCLFFGMLGLHRFYLGRPRTALLMLITSGGCGLWLFIDLALILGNGLKDGRQNNLV